MYLDMQLYAANVSIAERPTNKYHEADMKHTVKYPRLFLRLLGVWPLILKDSSTKQKFFSAFLILICVMALLFVIVPPSIDLILRKKDPTSWITAFAAIVYNSTNCFKYAFFVFRCKTIRLCLEHMKTDWLRIESEHDRVIMLQSVRLGHSVTIICCVFVWTSGMSYHTIMPFVSGATINEYNETIRPLAYSGFDIIFDLQSSTTYEIIFCTNIFSAFVTYNVTSASCSFAAGFVGHACGQMQIIMSQLENLVDSIEQSKNDNQLRNRLSLITRCHIRVLRLSSKIEEVVREICFMEVVSTTMIICFVEYYLVTEWSNSEPVGIVTYFAGLLSDSFNIFMLCYIGELLKEQGQQVGKAAYMIEWYKLPYKTSRDLMMIIIMGNYPPKITAGRVFELSIGSFGAILKMSMTYCNMLRALT